MMKVGLSSYVHNDEDEMRMAANMVMMMMMIGIL